MQLQTSLGRRGSDGNLMSSGKSGDGAGDTNETRDIARVMATHYKQLGGVRGLRATKLTHFKGNSEDRDPNSSFFFLFSQASVTTGETRNNFPAATSGKPEYRPAVIIIIDLVLVNIHEYQQILVDLVQSDHHYFRREIL